MLNLIEVSVMVEKTEKNVIGLPANQRVFYKGFKDACNELRANGTIRKIHEECTEHVLKRGFFFKGALYKKQDTDAETFKWFLEVASEVENDAKVEEENRSTEPTDHIKEPDKSVMNNHIGKEYFQYSEQNLEQAFHKANESSYASAATCKHAVSTTLACISGGVTYMANAGPIEVVGASVLAGLGAEKIMPDWLMIGGPVVLLGIASAMAGYRGGAEVENTLKAVNIPMVMARMTLIGGAVGAFFGTAGLLEGLIVEKSCAVYEDYFNG